MDGFPIGKQKGLWCDRVAFTSDGAHCLLSADSGVHRADRDGALMRLPIEGDLSGRSLIVALARFAVRRGETELVIAALDGTVVGSVVTSARPQGYALSPDGERVAVISSNSGPAVLEVWSSGGKRLATLAQFDFLPGIFALGFSSDGAQVVSSADGNLLLWPVAGGEPTVRKLRCIGLTNAPCLHVNSGNVVVSPLEGERGIVGLASLAGKLRWHSEVPYQAAQISPEGTWVVAAIAQLDSRGRKHPIGHAAIDVFSAKDGKRVRRIEWKSAAKEYVSDVAISEDGWVALATNKKTELFAPKAPGKATKPKRR